MQQYFTTPGNAVAPAPFTLGNAPRELSTARAPGTASTALSIFKQFHYLARESSLAEIRLEAFNALNHPQFSAPNAQVNSGQFGVVSSQANTPRTVQIGVKVYF